MNHMRVSSRIIIGNSILIRLQEILTWIPKKYYNYNHKVNFLWLIINRKQKAIAIIELESIEQ